MKYYPSQKILLGLIFCLIAFLFKLDFIIAQNNELQLVEYPSEAVIKLKNGNFYKIKFEDNTDINQIINDYKTNPEIEYIEPNYKYQITAFPNDTYYNDQIYLRKIKSKNAWSKELLEKQIKTLDDNSVIAVIDTGVDIDHPDLIGNIWQNKNEIAGNGIDDDNNGYIDDMHGWDFVGNEADPNPKFTLNYTVDAIHHGTIVSGIASAVGHNDKGITGVSWDSKIMALRALDSEGQGSVYDVSKAVAYAIENGADVINMSFVGMDYSQILYDEIKKAYDQGIMIVAAAGNTDASVQGVNLNQTKSYPVCFNASASVDISAPGEKFFGLQVYNLQYRGYDDYYKGYWSGTSVSTPIVSGSLALLKSLNPSLSNEEIQDILLDNADNIDAFNTSYKGQIGSGRLNLESAVEALILFNPELKIIW